MTATAYLFLVIAAIVIFGMAQQLERQRRQLDQLKVTHSRTLNLLAKERQKHLACAVRAVKAERALERADAALVEAGREAATHANHLEAVLEATSEKGLRLVKGAER